MVYSAMAVWRGCALLWCVRCLAPPLFYPQQAVQQCSIQQVQASSVHAPPRFLLYLALLIYTCVILLRNCVVSCSGPSAQYSCTVQ